LPSPPNTQQRQNIDDIDAFGVEAEGRYTVTDRAKLDAAFDLVDAHVSSRIRAPQLDGLRPAQAPRWTVTAGFEVTPLDPLSVSAHLRYESRRFADDLNTLPLSPATTVDARIAWAFTDALSVYVYGDNLFNAHVASTTQMQNLVEGGTGFVTSYSAPRIVGAGVSFAQ
jgi:outer membrane receptor protein involved in Fe transport